MGERLNLANLGDGARPLRILSLQLCGGERGETLVHAAWQSSDDEGMQTTIGESTNNLSC